MGPDPLDDADDVPLRARKDRIPAIAAQILSRAVRLGSAAPPRLSARAIEALAAYDWPGGVRELREVLERAVMLAPGGEIDARHIHLAPARSPTAVTADDAPARFVELARRHHGNVSAIARELSTSRSQVRRLAARFGADLDALKRDD
jgi:two-component system response regulator PilR (NtrC family)